MNVVGNTVVSLTILLVVFLVFIAIYIESQKIVIPTANISLIFQQFVPAAAIVIAVVIFIFEQRYENRRRRDDEGQRIVRSCNSLLKELDDHDIALNTSKYNHIINDKYNISFTNTFLAIHAFVRLLQSGSFSRFDSDTQNTLSKLYTRITLFNKQSDYMDEFVDHSNLSIPTSSYADERLRNIQQYLTLLEHEIKELLPAAITLIKDEKLKPH